jgi:hypothetical protein
MRSGSWQALDDELTMKTDEWFTMKNTMKKEAAVITLHR